MTLEELAAAATVLGVPLAADRLKALLPEVQRLRRQASQLRTLPLEAEEPATRFALE